MERLSNIMSTAQRLRPAADQRLPEYPSTQGQRGSSSTRHPFPEPHAHSEVTNRASEVYHSRSAPPSRLPEALEEDWREPMPDPSRLETRLSYNNQRTVRSGQHPSYSEIPPQGDYYEEIENSSVVSSNTQEEWGDDTVGMRYGDWENAPGFHYTHGYQEENTYMQPAPRIRESLPTTQEMGPITQRLPQSCSGSRPLPTREAYHRTPETMRPSPSHGLQEPRTPVPVSISQIAPLQHSQRQTQRTTQPLKNQQIPQLQIEQRPLTKVSQGEAKHPTVYIPAPYKNPAPICPTCKGAGYLRQDVPYGHPGFGKPVQCECKQKHLQAKRRLQRQETSNLRDFIDKRFDNFNPKISPEIKEAYDIAKEYAQDPYGWLILMGKVGCGKTHLAAAIANQYMECGETVLFTTAIDLLDHLRSTFAPSSEVVYDQLFARMREASLLVLDDLGTQQSSPWANEKMFQLLNYRYNLKMPTVITTNIHFNNIEERIRSRMMDASFVRAVVLNRVFDYRPRNPRRI